MPTTGSRRGRQSRTVKTALVLSGKSLMITETLVPEARWGRNGRDWSATAGPISKSKRQIVVAANKLAVGRNIRFSIESVGIFLKERA